MSLGENPTATGKLPSYWQFRDQIVKQIGSRKPVVFLDYDGTLAPIVSDPDKAFMPDELRAAVEHLARLTTIAIVSGRDLAKVRDFVRLDHITYAGSHGFDILHADGRREAYGTEYLPELDRAEHALSASLASLEGAKVERKRFALAIHYRNVAPGQEEIVERAVDEVAKAMPRLRKTLGKKVFELRPNVEWDKGRAVLALLKRLDIDTPETLPIYIGDDVTDEDAFHALKGRGLGILVDGGSDYQSVADYAVSGTDEVRRVLNDFAALLTASA